MEELLNDVELYLSELNRYPMIRYNRGYVATLVAAARAGDEQAKEQVFYECLHFVAYEAMKLRNRFPHIRDNVDYLDIVQEGNLAIAKHFERVLATIEAPVPYLCSIAKYEMLDYCLYRTYLIRVPETHKSTYVPKPHKVVSLSLPEYQETVAEIEDDATTEEASAFENLLGPLGEAMANLTEKERETVVRHYGLDGSKPESLRAMGKRLGVTHTAIGDRHRAALKKLRKHLKEA